MRSPVAVRLFSALILIGTARGVEPATRPAGPQSAEHTRELEALLPRYDRAIAERADDVSALEGRAEALFRLGRFDDAVRDFDKVVALDPASAPHNWQRGIALYYAGRYADGAKQFEQHQTVNPQDVENAAWHYLCLARSIGPEKGPGAARAKLIPIKSDARVPLMTVHALYAGRATPDDVIAAANARKPDADELRDRLFYAHLYLALYYEAGGRGGDAAKAAEHARLAATTYAVDGYMGDVARIHDWTLRHPAGNPATAPARAEKEPAGR
jgi:lipoprotein NlpI